MADPVIVHALGILGVTHQARHIHAAIDFELVTDHAHYGNPLARPFALFKDLEAVGLAPHDLFAFGCARAQRLAVHSLKLLVFGRAIKRSHVVGVEVEFLRFALVVEILRNPHRVLAQPLADALVAHALRHKRTDRNGVGELVRVFGLGDVFGNEAPLGVGAARILDRRVHIDAERVADAPDQNVLVEAIVAAIVRQDAQVAFAVSDLVVAGRVVGHIGVRHVLNVTHHAVEDLGNLNVALVVGGDDLAARAVLPLLVRHLTHMLGQLVDGQAGPRIDGLALHRATGSQDVRRPLPLVVGATRHEAQVVQLVLTGLTIGRDRHVEAGPHSA